MKAKYIGDPRVPGEAKNLPEEFTMFGITFERGKWAEVPDNLAKKFEGNTHFETSDGKARKAADSDTDSDNETVAQLTDRIAAVDDVDALRTELASETRAGGKKAIEARIAELEA